jgi:shikimate kinase
MRGLVLYGLKHSGKSSLARLISEHYAVPQWDLDDLILKAHPSAESIRQLYRDRGIEWFSREEYRAAESLPVDTGVIATGGGSMENEELVDLLIRHGRLAVFLDAPEDKLWKRIERGGIPPFLAGEDPRGKFSDLYLRRRARALEICDLRIETGEDTPRKVFNRLKEELADYGWG